MKKPRILIYDIETSPFLIEAWGTWQTDALRIVMESKIMCFSYKWLDDKSVKVVAMPDFKGYKPGRMNLCDKNVVTEMHKLFDEADILVAHNGDKFDQKRVRGRLFAHGFKPPSPNRSVDTLKLARRHFSLPSNRLDAIGRLLDVGHKTQHTGKDMWFDCMEGCEKAWRMMKRYAKQDTNLLEQVYIQMRPWAQTHPNLNAYSGLDACPKCGSEKLQKRGFSRKQAMSYQRYQCMNCGGWCEGRKGEKTAGGIK